MTLLSLQELAAFLNKYPEFIRFPIANYGGGLYEVDHVEKMMESGGIKLKGKYDILDYDHGVDLMKPIKKKYKMGICMDLLEHTENPFVIAKNIQNSLVKNSLLFVTTPWIWEIHKYPIDNWRFTADGLATLFNKMGMVEAKYLRDKHTDPEPVPRERLVAIFQKK